MLDKEVNEYRCPYDDCSEYLKKNKIRTAKDPLTHHKRRYHNDRDLAIYKLAIDAYNKGERISYGFEYNLNVLNLLKAFTNRAAQISYCENILLFMPVTIFGHLGNVHMVKSLKGSVLISFVMSIGIELIQGLEAILCIAEDMTPIMDVNDVICNTIGGAIGYMLVCFCADQHKNEDFDIFHSL